MTRTEISNSDDVIDSRDIIARVEELEGLQNDAETDATKKRGKKRSAKVWSHDGQREFYPSDDFGQDEEEELFKLKALAEQCEGYGDWSHGETLIRESYFVEYCQDLVSDIGDMPREIPGYIVIDWEATAKNLEADYMTVDFDGVDYLMRA